MNDSELLGILPILHYEDEDYNPFDLTDLELLNKKQNNNALWMVCLFPIDLFILFIVE